MTKEKMWKEVEEIEDAKSRVKWYERGKTTGAKIRSMIIDRMRHIDEKPSDEDLHEMANEIEWDNYRSERPIGTTQFEAYQTGIFRVLYKDILS